MLPPEADGSAIRALVAVARGQIPADVTVVGGRVVNVYTEEIIEADVAVREGRIAYVGPPGLLPDAGQVVDADGAFVIPGYIEPHAHPWLLHNPDTFARAVLPLGNTTVVGELLGFQLELDTEGLERLLSEFQRAPLRWLWAIRAAGQSLEDPTTTFPLKDVERLFTTPGAVQLAEVTGWAQVLDGDQHLTDRLALARAKQMRLDGHGAGVSPLKAIGLAAAGFTADHESITNEDALARLRLGFHVILRNSSLRPDLDEFMSLFRGGTGHGRVSLTTDGSGPPWIVEHGLVDGLVRNLVRRGVPIPRAVAMATINPATYLRMDEHIGGIAPGRCADLQVLQDFEDTPPELVMAGGQVVAREGQLAVDWAPPVWSSYGLAGTAAAQELVADPEWYRFTDPPGSDVAVMRFVSAGIIRGERVVADSQGQVVDALRAVLFSKDGTRIATAWVRGFAPELEGFASSATTSGDLVVLGSDPLSMAAAADAVARGPGGFAVVAHGQIRARLKLDLGFATSSHPVPELAETFGRVEAALRAAGYPYEEILFAVTFLTCDFLPDLRLTSRGVLNVKTGEIARPSKRIDGHSSRT